MTNFLLVITVFTFTTAFIPSALGQMMTGGHVTQDPSDPEYMEKAWKAAKSLNEDSSNATPYIMVPIKVVKAQTQVVAGTQYTFEILFGQSECKKGDVDISKLATANCQLIPNGSRALYKVVLWEKPWQNFEQYNVSKIRDVAAGEQL